MVFSGVELAMSFLLLLLFLPLEYKKKKRRKIKKLFSKYMIYNHSYRLQSRTRRTRSGLAAIRVWKLIHPSHRLLSLSSDTLTPGYPPIVPSLPSTVLLAVF